MAAAGMVMNNTHVDKILLQIKNIINKSIFKTIPSPMDMGLTVFPFLRFENNLEKNFKKRYSLRPRKYLHVLIIIIIVFFIISSLLDIYESTIQRFYLFKLIVLLTLFASLFIIRLKKYSLDPKIVLMITFVLISFIGGVLPYMTKYIHRASFSDLIIIELAIFSFGFLRFIRAAFVGVLFFLIYIFTNSQIFIQHIYVFIILLFYGVCISFFIEYIDRKNYYLTKLWKKRINDLETNNSEVRNRFSAFQKNYEQNLNLILDTIPLPVFIKDSDFRYKFINQEFALIFGMEKNEILNRKIENLNLKLTEKDLNKYKILDEALLEEGNQLNPQSYIVENIVLANSKDKVDYKFCKMRIELASQEYGIIGIMSNISDEINLIKDYELIRRYFKDGIVLTDRIGKVYYLNDACTKISGITLQEAKNQFIWDLHFSVLNFSNQNTKSYTVIKKIYNEFYKIGVSKWLNRVNYGFIKAKNTAIEYYAFKLSRKQEGNELCIIIRDVTSHKKSIGEYKENIANINYRYREINHRILNNYQILLNNIDAILNLKVLNKNNIFQLKTQIFSFLQLHNLLGMKEVGISSKINIIEILNSFIKYFTDVYSIPKKNISFHLPNTSIYLNHKYAFNLMILFNEAFTNSMKHSGRPKNKWKMLIQIKIYEENKLYIKIRDNGLKKSIISPNQHKSFGLDLINHIVLNQLKGKMKINRETGFEYEIFFNF
jgi:two-component sensor histidine kinase